MNCYAITCGETTSDFIKLDGCLYDGNSCRFFQFPPNVQIIVGSSVDYFQLLR